MELWVAVHLAVLAQLRAHGLEMMVDEFGETTLCLLVGKDRWGGEALQEASEARGRGFECFELLEEMLGRPVAWEPDHVSLDVIAQGAKVWPPYVELVFTQVPQLSQQGKESVRVGEMVGEIEFLGQLAARAAWNLHVVAPEPHGVLQVSRLDGRKYRCVENGLSNMWQLLIWGVVQARGQTLVFGRAVVGGRRGKAEALAQFR
ncbi:hypothetical protein OOK13_44410 [Streptomyces sp. NBC_00378]|nr:MULTISPECIES: hypothetical protein [unclassified Streptomyces]MCX5115353.1 hypothetical protein [Streptomyces sp. NBC_00378]